ncbi:hypothetical protein [Paenisporosarcina sp. NPDC076898]|uniref:hypothetical protein n=1 Tax=unclassified Paenisporosarcina TaxID=2642018 RepID=UPI003D08AB83
MNAKLQLLQDRINGDVKNLKVNLFQSDRSGSNESIKNAIIASEWAELDRKVADTRAEYAEFRTNEINSAKKASALNTHVLTTADHSHSKALATTVSLDLIAAADVETQNTVLNELEGVLALLTDPEKVAFGKHVPGIYDLLLDKAASKATLQGVINECKNIPNLHGARLAEAEALPAVIGDEYDTLKADYEASL